MPRINVYADDEDGQRILAGWFDPDKAEVAAEDFRYDEHTNRVSVHTGDQFYHQALYHTSGGRWVLHCWSQWQGSVPTYEFLTDEQAKTWLLVNGSDDVIAEHFGEVEEERGPGRPEVGKPINVRLGDELLAQVDAEAKRCGKSRADTLRDLVAQALAGQITTYGALRAGTE